MLRPQLSGSTQLRLSLTELGSFFFDPIQLHLQPTDLLEQLCRLEVFRLLRDTSPLKHRRSLIEQPTLPLMNLSRMNSMPLRQLTHRLAFLQRIQRNARLES